MCILPLHLDPLIKMIPEALERSAEVPSLDAVTVGELGRINSELACKLAKECKLLLLELTVDGTEAREVTDTDDVADDRLELL